MMIDKLLDTQRLQHLLERDDVIVGFSLLYLRFGSPKEYSDSVVSLRPGLERHFIILFK